MVAKGVGRKVTDVGAAAVFLKVLVAKGMTSSGSVVGEVAYVVVGPNEMDLPFLLTPSVRKEDFGILDWLVAASPWPPLDFANNNEAKSNVGGTSSWQEGNRNERRDEKCW